MLQQLRDKTKSLVSIVLLVLLVISFGIWGINDIFRARTTGEWVAKVGPVKISPTYLQHEFQNQVAQMRAVLGPNFSAARAKEAGLMQRALDQIVSTTTLQLETGRLGLHVGDKPVVAMLQATPQLRGADGNFDRTMFQRVLQNQGMTEAMFLDQQRRLLSRNILVRSLSLPVTVPQMAMDDFAKATAQRRVAELVKVDADKVGVPAPSDDVLKSYFDAHADEYKSSETRTFTVLNLSPADLGKNIAVTPEEVKAYFEQNRAQYEHPEKRDMIQVVLDSADKAKELSEAARKNGLAKAAKDLSLDPTTLNQLAKSDLPPALGDVVFAKSIGQIGGPVQTNLGYHVFSVEKITPGRKETFDEVAPAIRTHLQSDKAAEGLVQTANKIDDMLAGGKSLEDIATSFGLKLEKLENQKTGVKLDDTSVNAEMLKAAFQQNEGETSPLMERKEGGYGLVRVDKINSSHNEDFANTKDKVKADWTKSERMKKAAETVATAAEKLKKGDSLSSIGGDGLVKSTSKPVRIDEWKDSGVPREALTPLFNMNKGEVAIVSTADGDIAVRVKSIQAGSDKDVENRKAALKDHLSEAWLAQHMEEMGNALQKTYPVTVDEKELQRMATEN